MLGDPVSSGIVTLKWTAASGSQFELMEESAYISYMFSPTKVAEITGLKDAKLVEFMNMYRPNYDWMRKHTSDDDILDYVNSKMKDYRKKGKA